MKTDPNDYNIKVVERCFHILDFANEKASPISIPDVCTALDINSNMAFRLLASLQNSGYMVKDPYTGLFSISLKTLRLSRNALQTLDIRKVTMPYLELIWNKYPKANVNMAVYYQGDVLVIDRIDSQSLPRTYFTPGRTLPFHCTGLGKILTCSLPEDQIDKLIAEKGLKQYTSKTLISPEAVKAELRKVNVERVARDRNEFIAGDNCSAVPIYGRDAQIVAAISISALDNYMTVQEVEDTIPTLKDTAIKVSYMLGFNND